MKKNIKEQVTKSTIPEKELQILQGPQFTKTGQLVLLCPDRQGNPTPINVDGKTYFGGTKRGENYFVYDGFVLKRIGTEGCKFEKLKDANGNVVRYKEVPNQTLAGVYDDKLLQFGINPNDPQTDKLDKIKQITEILKKLIEVGAKSNIFKLWNQIVSYYYPNNPETQLKTKDGSTLEPPVDENDRNSMYRKETAGSLGVKFLNKDIVIYYPINVKTPTGTKPREKYTSDNCKTSLVEYLGNSMAFATNQQPEPDQRVNNNNTRNFIRGCYGAGMYDSLSVDMTDLDPYVQLGQKNTPFKWYRKGKTLDFDNINSLLTGKSVRELKPMNPYLPFYIDQREGMRESVKKSKLNTLIKENLTKLSEEKQNNLIAETKIIQTRTKILTENRILKFKQPREKFFNEIISEAIYLESQGFDKELIKEEFWDTIKGMFGQHGSEAIFGTFKEYMGKWLLQKLTPVNPDGWIGSIVVTAIGNLHIDDLSKLTDCNFLTKKLASSIGEGIARKIQHDKGYDGGISDIVRNGLFSAIDNNEMVKSLENGLAKLICPALSGVKTKLEDKAQQMKTKALQA